METAPRIVTSSSGISFEANSDAEYRSTRFVHHDFAQTKLRVALHQVTRQFIRFSGGCAIADADQFRLMFARQYGQCFDASIPLVLRRMGKMAVWSTTCRWGQPRQL